MSTRTMEPIHGAPRRPDAKTSFRVVTIMLATDYLAMSRFSLRPLAHHTDLFEIALGWDPGLGTYFVTVFGTPDRDREPDIRLWRGTSPREIGAPCEIIAIASAYAEIPDGLARQLEIDRLACPHNPDRPASKLLEELLGRSRSAPG